MYRKALYRQTGTNLPLATEVSTLISLPAKHPDNASRETTGKTQQQVLKAIFRKET